MNASNELPPAVKDVDLCGVPLGRSRHACAFFNSKEDEYRALLPFFTEGFGKGDRSVHIVDPNRKAEHVQILRDEGVDTEGAIESGQLVVKGWDEAYLLDGRFDQSRMLAMIEDFLQEGKRKGYRLTRLMADVEWAIEDRPGVMDLVEYETNLNYILPHYDDAVVCIYDLAQFGAETVMDIMRTHPMVIIGCALFENPFYVPPDEMLKELRERPRRPERHR